MFISKIIEKFRIAVSDIPTSLFEKLTTLFTYKGKVNFLACVFFDDSVRFL